MISSSFTSLFGFISIVPRSTYAGRQLLVGYWGQNGAGPANGPANYEQPLFEVCKTTKYDILAVSFVIVFFDSRNKGKVLIFLELNKKFWYGSWAWPSHPHAKTVNSRQVASDISTTFTQEMCFFLAQNIMFS